MVVILLLISILLEQAIAGLCPLLNQLGGVRPMIVFLDIPLETPVTIDWLPVGFIFIVFYSIVRLPRSKAADNIPGSGEGIFGRGWTILGRWWLLLICILIGGGIYAGVSDFLPKTIRNGIDSFGLRADLILPYPSGETVHLHGSMIILVFFMLGWRMMINKAAPPVIVQSADAHAVARSVQRVVARSVEKPASVRPLGTVPKPSIATPPPSPISSESAAPARGRNAMRIPEPVELNSAGGRPCVYVSMPAGFQKKRTSYPCIVENGIRPKPNIS